MISLQLPAWIKPDDKLYKTDGEKALKAIELSRLNVEHETGGVFGAAVFDETGKVVSQGVNLVVPERTSVAHAEIVAIMFAQKKLGMHDLSIVGNFTLATSAEPCAMCAGAIMWSGLYKVIFSATSKDVEEIGFDEGDKPNLYSSFSKRGIRLAGEVHRFDAVEVLKSYEGMIYNAKNNRLAK